LGEDEGGPSPAEERWGGLGEPVLPSLAPGEVRFCEVFQCRSVEVRCGRGDPLLFRYDRVDDVFRREGRAM
jgi:hypothetical protein